MKKSRLMIVTALAALSLSSNAWSGQRAEDFLQGIKERGYKKLSYDRVVDKDDLLEFENLSARRASGRLAADKLTIKDHETDSVIVEGLSLFDFAFWASAETLTIDGLDSRVGHQPFVSTMFANASIYDAADNEARINKFVMSMRNEDGADKAEIVLDGSVTKGIFASFMQPVLAPLKIDVTASEKLPFEATMESMYVEAEGRWNIRLAINASQYGQVAVTATLDKVTKDKYLKIMRDMTFVTELSGGRDDLISLFQGSVLAKLDVELAGTYWIAKSLETAEAPPEFEGNAPKAVIADRLGNIAGALASRWVSSEKADAVYKSINSYIGSSQQLLLSLKSSKSISEIFGAKPSNGILEIDIRVPEREIKRSGDATDRHE